MALVALSGAVALGRVLTPEAVPGFAVPPYWQQTEDGRALLKFQTRDAVAAEIRLEPPVSAPLQIQPATGLVSIPIEGLKPGVRYAAAIDLKDGHRALASVKSVDPQAQEVRILVAGDSRRYPDRARRVAQAAANETFDLFLHTGDLVNYPGERSQFPRYFFSPLAGLLSRAELIPVMGNHEDASTEYHDYFDLPGNERWFRTVRGPVELIVLATDEWLEEQSPQLRWLDGVLKDPLRPFRIAVFHRPAVAWAGKEPSGSGAKLLPARLRRAGVQLVLTGHNHLYERALKLTEPEILYVTVGNAGSNWHSGLRERPADVVGRAVFETLGYASVHVSGDNATLESKDTHGAVLDRCQYREDRWSCETND